MGERSFPATLLAAIGADAGQPASSHYKRHKHARFSCCCSKERKYADLRAVGIDVYQLTILTHRRERMPLGPRDDVAPIISPERLGLLGNSATRCMPSL